MVHRKDWLNLTTDKWLLQKRNILKNKDIANLFKLNFCVSNLFIQSNTGSYCMHITGSVNISLYMCVSLLVLCALYASVCDVCVWKGVLKICSKFTGEHPCGSVISIKLQTNFIEITLRHGCSPVNLLHILEHFFLGTPLSGCIWMSNQSTSKVRVIRVKTSLNLMPCSQRYPRSTSLGP